MVASKWLLLGKKLFYKLALHALLFFTLNNQINIRGPWNKYIFFCLFKKCTNYCSPFDQFSLLVHIFH